ncbi:MAG: hypothetical protein GY717_20210 [Rhodobacteraceae bacterium]|nr:hypothetical protein [Paracoccaceae bacterium]
MTGQTIAFWAIQGPGWLLVAYLVVAQCLSAVSYGLGVRLGMQEPAGQITEVGVGFFWAFAFADLVFYTPILALGLVGHWLGSGWGVPVLAAALGTTVYWPIVCLAGVARTRGAPGWSLPKERDYWIVLPGIALWGAWGLFHLVVSVA